MRDDFETKIAFAELENKYNEELERDGLTMSIFGRNKRGYLASIKTVDRKPLNLEHLQLILEKFERTDDLLIGEDNFPIPYYIGVYRGPKDVKTIMSVRWISGEFEIWTEVPVDEDCPDIMQFFRQTTRKLTESEISSYGIQRNRWNYNYRNYFTFLTFTCGHVIAYPGGRHVQVDVGIITSIIETIKWMRPE